MADDPALEVIDPRTTAHELLAACQTVSPYTDEGLAKQKSRTAVFKLLLDCLALQIRFGCEADECTTPSCFSYRKSLTHEPVRRPTVLTARNSAFVLASANSPLRHLCVHPLRTSVDGHDRVDTQRVRAYVKGLLAGGGQHGLSSSQDINHENGDGTSNGDNKPSKENGIDRSPANRQQHVEIADRRHKIDKGSLAQVLFNTDDMRAWFSSAVPKQLAASGSEFAVHKDKGIHFALLIFQQSQKLRLQRGAHDQKARDMFEYASQSSRYCLTSLPLLLQQYAGERSWMLLRDMPDSLLDTVATTCGEIVYQIPVLERPMVEFLNITDDAARKHMFDCMWYALDPLFNPPPGLSDSTSSSGHEGKYVNDIDAAQIIFLAISLLGMSLPISNVSTLATVLGHRAQGSLIPTPLNDADEHFEPGIKLQAKRVRVSDAFEDPSAVRLAGKVVNAIGIRRAHWLGTRNSQSEDEKDENGLHTTFPIMCLIAAHFRMQWVAHDSGGEGQESHAQWLQRRGLNVIPIFLEWLKTVFRASWNGEHVVSRWTGAGAALDIMKDARFNFGVDFMNKHGLSDEDHLLPTLSSRLHAHKAIPDYLAWMQASPAGSRRHRNERHLLEYSFILSYERRTSFFRLMMYHQMYHQWQYTRGQREIGTHFDSTLPLGASNYRCPDRNCNHAMCERLRVLDRQSQRWVDAGYSRNQRFPSNFWDRDLYLRSRMASSQQKFLVLDIERQTILESAFNQLWGREIQELLKPMKVVMRMDGKDEDAADHGGVSQEFFRLVLAKAFDPKTGLFVETDEKSRAMWFQPLSLEPLQTYELLGLLFGMAVYNGITIPVNFPYVLYQLLCGESKHACRASEDWPTLQKSFSELLSWNESHGSVEDVFARDFAFAFTANGVTYTIDMLKEDPECIAWSTIPGDLPPAHWTDDTRTFEPVTAVNRKEFIDAYAMWLMVYSVQPQLDAFTKGFRYIIPGAATTFFGATALRKYVEGDRDIDIDQLRAATSYATRTSPDDPLPRYSNEYSSEHPTIKHFWNVVSKYDQHKLRQLLTFVTASDRVPAQGYRAIGFSIEKNGGVERLPTSSTCFGKLFLPPYRSEERLEKMLGIALEEGCAGFGFM